MPIAAIDFEPLGEELNRLFSRKVLGSVVVGGAATEVLSLTIVVFAGDTPRNQLLAWVAVLLLGIVLFVWWDHLQETTEAARDSASERTEETLESMTETASETVESAREALESATEDD